MIMLYLLKSVNILIRRGICIMTDNEKLDLILSKMAGIEQSITGLEQSVMGIKQNVTGIEQSVAGLEQSVTGIEQRIEELEAGFEQKLEIIDQRLTRLESHIENVTDKNIRIVAEGHVDLNRKLNEVIHVTSDIKAYHELQNILVSDHEDRLKHII